MNCSGSRLFASGAVSDKSSNSKVSFHWPPCNTLSKYPSAFRRIGLAPFLALFALILSACDGDESFELELPIDCVPGETCWAVGYMDVDPGPGAKDYLCGNRTADGSEDTLFAIRDIARMRAGVQVRAAASGVVTAVQTGMRDSDYRKVDPIEIEGRECGNGIEIDHGDGWVSHYCHLKRRKLLVREGQVVRAGDPLGYVGMSGKTFLPHLRFGLRREGRAIDPFTGRPKPEGSSPPQCSVAAKPLWKDSVQRMMPYRLAMLYNMGIEAHKPSARFARNGGRKRVNSIPRSSQLYLWVDMFYVEKYDSLSFELYGPNGRTIIYKTVELRDRKARQFYYMGRRIKPGSLPSGVYKGTVTLQRRTPDGNKKVTARTSVKMR